MREDFLHYIWRFQKYNTRELKTTCGQSLQIEKVGIPNSNAGPDFLMGQIVIGQQKWVGHIEIHIKASDWLAHKHHEDPNYETVILHVVWESDKEIVLPNGGELPVLEMKSRIDEKLIHQYNQLMIPSPGFIPCEKNFAEVPDLVMKKWMERLFLERLEKKCTQLRKWLEQTKFHWEAVSFYALARAFGMKVNADSFVSIAQSVDFSILQKCKSHPIVTEALLLGQAGLLERDCKDPYFKTLKATYKYLIHKFKLEQQSRIRAQFFRLRPSNFPTIRLSQLSVLWSKHPTLIAVFKKIENRDQAYEFLSVESSNFWQTHYRFDKESSEKPKILSKAFIDLIIINVVIPIRLVYGQLQGNLNWEKLETLAQGLPMETNMVLSRYQQVRKIEKNAMSGQALLHLHANYCKSLKCLSCEIGNHLLKSK